MFWILKIIIPVVLSYFLGSVPFGFLVTKKIKGIDIRKFGSGNIGATNVVRVLGGKWGFIVFLMDFLKGVLPVGAAFYIFGDSPYSVDIAIISALAAIAGHNWPVFLKFRGGKGVATSIGAVTGLAFNLPLLRLPVVVTILVWVGIFLLFKTVGIASVVSAVSLSIFCFFMDAMPLQIRVLSLLIALFIVFRHLKNLKEFFQNKR
jgi:acyl phosphate:glycerol-3-phosphate acyltransferase